MRNRVTSKGAGAMKYSLALKTDDSAVAGHVIWVEVNQVRQGAGTVRVVASCAGDVLVHDMLLVHLDFLLIGSGWVVEKLVGIVTLVAKCVGGLAFWLKINQDEISFKKWDVL